MTHKLKRQLAALEAARQLAEHFATAGDGGHSPLTDPAAPATTPPVHPPILDLKPPIADVMLMLWLLYPDELAKEVSEWHGEAGGNIKGAGRTGLKSLSKVGRERHAMLSMPGPRLKLCAVCSSLQPGSHEG